MNGRDLVPEDHLKDGSGVPQAPFRSKPVSPEPHGWEKASSITGKGVSMTQPSAEGERLQPTIRCEKCSELNPEDRLWCTACGAALPETIRPQLEEHSQVWAEREQLYRQVLDDLQSLIAQREADATSARVIRDFYEARLAQISSSAAQLAFEKARRTLFKQVRSTAHAGRLEAALAIIDNGLQRFPSDVVLQSLREEVDERWEQCQLASQKSKQAAALSQEAENAWQRDDLTKQWKCSPGPSSCSRKTRVLLPRSVMPNA